MSDREKVIKGLEWILNDIEENGHYQVGYYADEIREAIDLLKKQESEWLEDSDPGQDYEHRMRSLPMPYNIYFWG